MVGTGDCRDANVVDAPLKSFASVPLATDPRLEVVVPFRPITQRTLLLCVCLLAVALASGCSRGAGGSGGLAASSGSPTSGAAAAQSAGAATAAKPGAAPRTIAGANAAASAAAQPDAAAAQPSADSLQPPSYVGYEPLVTFTYHHVDPKLVNEIAITPATFEAQLRAMKAAGFQSVTARELLKHQTDGTSLPPKPIMLTFDDGWRNQYTYAAPLLDKYGYKGVFFINPQSIGTYPAYMTRKMVESLDGRGHDIESHTWQHLRVTRKREVSAATFQKRMKRQFTLADEWIKTVTGKQPVALCYPFGFYDTEAVAFASDSGYKLAFTVDEGVADARPWDAMVMKRFTMQRVYSLATFKSLLDAAPLQVRDIQPGPGSRVVGLATTIRVDITEVPASVKGIKIYGGPSVKVTTISEKDGHRYAAAPLVKSAVGLKAITVKAHDTSGRKYFASWVLTMGDLKK